MTNFKNLLNKVLEGTDTPDEYDAFLALYETGEHDHELTAEDVGKVMATFQSRATGVEYIVAADARDEIRSRIRSRQQPVHRYRSKAWLLAATVSFALVFGLWFMAEEKNWFGPSAEKQRTNLARFSGKQVVDLPDGTQVILNENSELSYTRPFGEANREVSLIGEASFDVAHDESKPFLVRTGKVTTKVLGTEFNVKAYADQTEITVTVLRGLVEVGDEEKIYGQIRPNEQIAVNVHSHTFVQQKTNSEDAVQWKRNFIILDDVDLEQAATVIGKKFNVRITLENQELKKCRIMVRFLNNENLDKVLEVISRVTEVTYTVEKDGDVVLSGKGCN